MMKRAGYPEYAERTSMFFPLPPKKRPDRSPSAAQLTRLGFPGSVASGRRR